jgi:hypothetical protein
MEVNQEIKITNLRQKGTLVFLSAIGTTLIIAVALADAPILGQNNRVTVTYTNATGTLTNIPGLSLTLLPNTVYQFTVSAIYNSGAAKFAVGPLPAGSKFTICGQIYALNGVQAGCTSTIGDWTNLTGSDDRDESAHFAGSITTGPTGGTFNMQGATFTGYGTTLIVEINSWIQAQVSSA